MKTSSTTSATSSALDTEDFSSENHLHETAASNAPGAHETKMQLVIPPTIFPPVFGRPSQTPGVPPRDPYDPDAPPPSRGGFPSLPEWHAPWSESRRSDKERATDVPSWSKNYKQKPNESCKAFAERILKEHYGENDQRALTRGADSEYSKIQKNCERK